VIPQVIPKLGLWQRFQLWVCGSVFLRWEKPRGYTGFVPLYVVRCRRHGVYVDHPHGYGEYFRCPVCFAEVAGAKGFKALGGV